MADLPHRQRLRSRRRPPPSLQRLAAEVAATIPQLTRELQHPPRASDIAARLQADLGEVIEILTTDGHIGRHLSPPPSVAQPTT